MPADLARVKELFLAVLALPASERAAYLDTACAGDPELRRHIEAMLTNHDNPAAPPAESVRQVGADAATQLDATIAFEYPGKPSEPLGGQADEDWHDLHFLTPSTTPGRLGQLAHYEVQQVLGKGGFGIVLKAFDERLHRLVAVKVLAPAYAANSAARKRFIREARTAAAVKNEYVVGIHEIQEDAQPPYLVMEYVDGVSLQDVIEKHGPPAIKEILRIGLQIARGLAAAHKLGLVHRDIKPANILLEHGGERVKITDFGMARAVDDASLTQSGTIAGTPMYMSPEQAEGLPVDHRSDLFSLGSVLYALCTGQSPFRAVGTHAVLKRVIDASPQPIRAINPDIPPWLAIIIAKLHAQKPEERLQSAQELAELLAARLAEVEAGVGIDASPSDSVATGPRPAWLSRVRVFGMLACVYAALSVAGFFLCRALALYPADYTRPAVVVLPIASLFLWTASFAAAWRSQVQRTLRSAAACSLLLASCSLSWTVFFLGNAGWKEVRFECDDPEVHLHLSGPWINKDVAPGSHHLPTGGWPTQNDYRLTAKKNGEVYFKKEFRLHPGSDMVLSIPTPAAVAMDNEPGWVPLFNGRDLDGWTTHPDQPGKWEVKDEAITCSGHQSHLFTRREYDWFHLRMEVKINHDGDSGVSFRAAFGQWFKGPTGMVPRGYESQIIGSALNDNTGTISWDTELAAARDTLHKPDEWFTLEIRADGSWISTSVNGKPAAAVRDSRLRPDRGVIGLQHFDPKTSVHFRRIAIKQLPPIHPPALAVAPFNAVKAREHQDAWARYLGVPVEADNAIGMKFRLIPPGEFMMGSSEQEIAALLADAAEWEKPIFKLESPQRRVTISAAFYLGAHEVTVGQFRRFVRDMGHETTAEATGMGRKDVGGGKIETRREFTWKDPAEAQSDEYPVVQVSYADAREFCKWLNKKDGREYVLPREDQWEFACRAGTATPWFHGEQEADSARYMWFTGNSRGTLHPVAELLANPFGLYDMLGNAEELCEGSATGPVARGGHATSKATHARSAARAVLPASHETWYRRGFRVAIFGDLAAKQK